MRLLLSALAGGVLLLAGCSDSTSTEPGQGAGQSSQQGSEQGSDQSSEQGSEQMFPDVVDVEVEQDDGGTYTFDVTMSSPYDTPERYADGWRVMSEDGEVYAEMTLTHDHASEQPFTRTQSGVEIPEAVTSVVIEGRDQANGYGGQTKTVELPSG